MRCIIFPDVGDKFLIYATSVFAGSRQYDSLYGPFPGIEDALFFAREKLRPRRTEEEVEIEVEAEKILPILKLFTEHAYKCTKHVYTSFPETPVSIDEVFFEREKTRSGKIFKSLVDIFDILSRCFETACLDIIEPGFKHVLLLDNVYACVYYGDDTISPQVDMVAGVVSKNKSERVGKTVSSRCVDMFVDKLRSMPALGLCSIYRVENEENAAGRVLIFLPDVEMRFSIRFAEEKQDFKILKTSFFVPELSVYIPSLETMKNKANRNNAYKQEKQELDEIDKENLVLTDLSLKTLNILCSDITLFS